MSWTFWNCNKLNLPLYFCFNIQNCSRCCCNSKLRWLYRFTYFWLNVISTKHRKSVFAEEFLCYINGRRCFNWFCYFCSFWSGRCFFLWCGWFFLLWWSDWFCNWLCHYYFIWSWRWWWRRLLLLNCSRLFLFWCATTHWSGDLRNFKIEFFILATISINQGSIVESKFRVIW